MSIFAARWIGLSERQVGTPLRGVRSRSRDVRKIAAFAAFLIFALPPAIMAREPWATLHDCRYLSKRFNDGDSFHVSVSGTEYIFRLYFVDAPETDTEFRDRIEDQAKYFGITTDQAVALGELAKQFTREKLGQPFIVRTCREDAVGRSKLKRFYAFVQTSDGDLGEQLVENGLARVHGLSGQVGDLTAITAEWEKLNRLEQKARKEKVGGWGAGEGRIATRASQPESAKGVDPFDTFFNPPAQSLPRPTAKPKSGKASPPGSSTPAAAKSDQPAFPQASENASAKLDINTASQAELENVPGIGPAMAQRIIEARPFNNADELKRIKGFGGEKKYQQVRPFFQ